MIGFTFPLGRRDVFVETTRKNKTEALASQIIRKLLNEGFDIPDNHDVRKEVLHYLRKATCEIRTLPNGRSYYEIAGENFGGRGSWLDDGNTIIVKLDN